MITVNKNDNVLVVKFRWNPQLGSFCMIEVGKVVVKRRNTIVVDSMHGFRNYSSESGEEKNPSTGGYGELWYKIFTFEQAKEYYNKEQNTFDNIRITSMTALAKEELNK